MIYRFLLVITALTIISIGAASCRHTRVPVGSQPPPPEVLPGIDEAQDDAAEVAQTVTDTAKGLGKVQARISENVDSIRARAPALSREASNLTQAGSHLSTYKERLHGASDRLASLEGTLRTTKDNVSTLEQTLAAHRQLLENNEIAHQEELSEKQAQIDALEDKSQARLRQALMYLLLLGVVTIAVAGMMFAQGNLKAISLGAGGIVLIVVCLALSYFMAHLAIVGAVAVLITLIILVWKVREQLRDKRAIEEIVRVTEEAKDRLSSEHAEAVFGPLDGAGLAGEIQSAATADRVARVRRRMGQELQDRINPSINKAATPVPDLTRIPVGDPHHD